MVHNPVRSPASEWRRRLPVSDIHDRRLLSIRHRPARIVALEMFPVQVHLGLELAVHRVHVHSAQGAVAEAPGDIRRDTARWFDIPSGSSRRQRVKLMAADVSPRRAVLLIPRVVHVDDLTLLALPLVLGAVRSLVLLEVLVVVRILPWIVRVHLLVLVHCTWSLLSMILLLLALYARGGLSVLQGLLDLMLVPALVRLRGRVVRLRLNDPMRGRRIDSQQRVI